MYENNVMLFSLSLPPLCWGRGWNLFKIKIESNMVQESIVPAIVTLDNTSSQNSTNLIPEQFF
jgi:hypothetical protein